MPPNPFQHADLLAQSDESLAFISRKQTRSSRTTGTRIETLLLASALAACVACSSNDNDSQESSGGTAGASGNSSTSGGSAGSSGKGGAGGTGSGSGGTVQVDPDAGVGGSQSPTLTTEVNVIITADNAYGFGYGTAEELLNYAGGVENPDTSDIFDCPVGNGPEMYTVPATDANAGSFLYIVSYADRLTTQGRDREVLS